MNKELYSSLLGAAPSLTLTPIVFFNPTEKFFVWFSKQYPDQFRDIYDVGAGLGHTSRLLKDRGYYPKAIDIAPRELQEYEVEQADGASYEYHPGSIVLICRPCHGYFPEFVVQQAFESRVTNIIYIGFEKNLENDLGKYSKDFKLAATEVGEDGESLWLCKKYWKPGKHVFNSTILGGTKLSDVNWIPKPYIHEFDDPKKLRQVKASTNRWSGFPHYHTSLKEEDSELWDPEYQRWLYISDDPKVKGQLLTDRFLTIETAKAWVEFIFKKRFGKGHKLVWEYGKKDWGK